MSRIRTIKPDFFRSRSLARCSIAARLTFAGLWCEADDHGRGIADARLLKGSIWPLDDAVKVANVEGHLTELQNTQHITIYTIGVDNFYEIHSWEKHQAAAYRRGDAIHPEPLPLLEIQEPHDQTCKEMRDARPIVLEGKGLEGIGREKACDPKTGRVDVPNSVPIPDDFPEFWNLYPKRNDKKLGKATSGRLWSKLSHGDRAVALSAVTNYAEACDTALTISKDPERWLRGRCWVDWLEPAKVAASTRAVGGVLAGSVAFGDSYYGRSQR